LNEQKQAIINRAVTRGLDPDVPLKPSGIEWLGEIPEHWEVRRIKSLSQVKRGASPRPIHDAKYFDDFGDFAWVRIADVTASERYLERTTQKLSILGQSKSVEMLPGSLFLSIAGSVGKPIITKIKCCIHDGFVYFPQFNGNTEFLYYVFASGRLYGVLGKLGTQLNLNTDTVGAISIAWPPENEQTMIVKYLDQALSELNRGTAIAQREITLIREYRTRLIADVVTGQVDVRHLAPSTPLPADDALDEALAADVLLDDEDAESELDSDEDDA
jgi:type I restriction enzyme S subunit